MLVVHTLLLFLPHAKVTSVAVLALRTFFTLEMPIGFLVVCDDAVLAVDAPDLQEIVTLTAHDVEIVRVLFLQRHPFEVVQQPAQPPFVASPVVINNY